MQLSNDLTLGASLHGGIPMGNGALVAGGVQMPDLRSTDVTSIGAASGLIGALVSTTNIMLGTSIPSYGILLNALSSGQREHQRGAHIIALDNDEAKFKVGTNIPYKKGVLPTSIAASGAPTAVSVNIDRADLAIELDIKPHISNDMVLLEIKHEANDLGDQNADLGPSWTTRSFETKVTVRDQQTVVIGGMMQEREVLSVSKVPLLGDVPLLGHLFSYTSRSRRKTNLLILLTPYIIEDQLDLERIQERKVREHDEFIRSFHALDHAAYQPKLDYTHKRGLVEDINRTLVGVEQDRAEREGFTKHAPVVTGRAGAAAA